MSCILLRSVELNFKDLDRRKFLLSSCHYLQATWIVLFIVCLNTVCVERMTGEPPPLMEGEGRELRILGFNHRQRSVFVNVLMR